MKTQKELEKLLYSSEFITQDAKMVVLLQNGLNDVGN